jgi:hypothetical protein
MLAAISKTPEFEMDEERASKIEKATASLADLYPVGFNRKLEAWTNFGFAFGGWFVPGAIAWWNHPKAPGPRRVIPMQQQPQQQQQRPSQESAPIMDLPMVSKPVDQSNAKVPSDMWQQPGDILDPSAPDGGFTDIAGE